MYIYYHNYLTKILYNNHFYTNILINLYKKKTIFYYIKTYKINIYLYFYISKIVKFI